MIVRPGDFDGTAYDQTKLAVAAVCNELGISFNGRLSSMWVVPVAEPDRQDFIDLVNEQLRELRGFPITEPDELKEKR